MERNFGSELSTFLPGIVQLHPNESITKLRRASWASIFALLGADAESIFLHLLLDCAVFVKVPSGRDNLLQFSGVPIHDNAGDRQKTSPTTALAVHTAEATAHPSAIKFVRNRMLYGKPALNHNGEIKFGLKHVHVLERKTNIKSPIQTLHVMKHVFPRQFGLHNVFTSVVDPRQSSHPQQDYTYREDELQHSIRKSNTIPRRLRGGPQRIVHKMRQRHSRCSHSQLLRYFCPVGPSTEMKRPEILHRSDLASGSTALITQPPSNWPVTSDGQTTGREVSDFFSCAAPAANVSAFCQAVLKRTLPRDMFGVGDSGDSNWRHVWTTVDRFVKMRRFETLSLHEVCQGMKVKAILWLQPPNMTGNHKLAIPEVKKRLEILHELVYYIFDSLIMPIIRANFYVTESGPYRNQLFYFRHDVWRKLTEPSLAMMRSSLYKQIPMSQVRRVLDSKKLGYSYVRLLPKADGTRPITNLRRRVVKTVGARRLLGPSINSQLSPVFCALTYERHHEPAYLGGTIFSIGGLRDKLKEFKGTVGDRKLYFVKADVQSCFDSIPQRELLQTIEKILKHSHYWVAKYAQLKSSNVKRSDGSAGRRPRYPSLAHPASSDDSSAASLVASIFQQKAGLVVAGTGMQKVWKSSQLLKLLQEHVQSNVVKIGRKHFKQTNGIPQGSVLSSILCSYFYSSFEAECLGFLNSSCLLVRLIDDFLLITTEGSMAHQFLQVMTSKHETYGISVNPDKTLANFDVLLNGKKIPRHSGRGAFPYCGVAIDTNTLELRKERQRKDVFVQNGLTVVTSKQAGASLRRKVLVSLTIQMQPMLLDATLNSTRRITVTLLEAFAEAGMKLHRYLKIMPIAHRVRQQYIITLVEDMIRAGVQYSRSSHQTTHEGQGGTISSSNKIRWMAAASLERVLSVKQSQYPVVLQWLRSLRKQSEASMGMSRKSLEKLLEDSRQCFESVVY